mmetsp:Transcript_82981/g.114579  ORF Transcript_82981/g.114579 Transcript_82981/m.114579 type:complete len:92 (+) Transcript_82981:354-629(+)|eukprot:CAMPEP_0176344644 /NCGR_PEP_ID=MMETSP0126-20121128/4850_1 /TAXON_ID=141414 ORGANISM="Strombidinopsis acuminatum, Strain SPMC142" /NCGR_SAMPLE_ID=MMETSP0126 /ASSEMBLY_ACC=CAM_ASM_000229 /LENGTH=91 /DNA_ID=CAMNT_0017691199 /DNA_START=462 /DNA_END=737 /DNA_ORIENTATION=-
MNGSLGLRTAVGNFFAKYSFKKPVDPKHVAVQAGTGAMYESLSYMLTNPGDSVLIPEPIYAQYTVDFYVRNEVCTRVIKADAKNRFEPTTE